MDIKEQALQKHYEWLSLIHIYGEKENNKYALGGKGALDKQEFVEDYNL